MNLTSIRVFNPIRHNIRRQQLNKERTQNIRYENLFLLKKIEKISLRKPSYNQPFTKQTLNYSLRKEKCQKINRENQKFAIRLQSQQSNYSQQLYRSTDRKRSNTSLSVFKPRAFTSLQSMSNCKHKSKMNTKELVSFDGFKSRTHIFNESIKIKGILFSIQLSKSSGVYFVKIQGFSNGKKYKLCLTKKMGDYLFDVLQSKQYSFTEMIYQTKTKLFLRIPLKGFTRVYQFQQLKQTQQVQKSLTSSINKPTKQLQPQLFSIQLPSTHQQTQQTKQIINQNCEQQILSQSSHSYMYRQDDLT